MSPKFESLFDILFLTGGDVIACDLDRLNKEEYSTLLALTYIRLDDASAIVNDPTIDNDAYDKAYHTQWCLRNLTEALQKKLS